MSENNYTPGDEAEIKHLAGMFQKMGPPKSDALNPTTDELRARARKELIDDKTTMKCACNKVVVVDEMPKVPDAVAGFYVDNVCESCPERSKGLVTVICASCKRVVLRFAPETDNHGFRFYANVVYHVGECKLCQPHIIKSPIIEQLLHHMERGIT